MGITVQALLDVTVTKTLFTWNQLLSPLGRFRLLSHQRSWTLLSAPVPPTLPLTACQLPGSGCIEGRTEGKIFRLSELTSIVKIWEMLTLKPVRELSLKDWAAHQCLLQPPSSLPRSPTAITNTPSTTVFATRCTRFIPTKLLVYLVGGGGLNQVFHHQIFQDVSWDHCLLKNYFRHTKYLYKYYLLVSCYSSFGCKL